MFRWLLSRKMFKELFHILLLLHSTHTHTYTHYPTTSSIHEFVIRMNIVTYLMYFTNESYRLSLKGTIFNPCRVTLLQLSFIFNSSSMWILRHTCKCITPNSYSMYLFSQWFYSGWYIPLNIYGVLQWAHLSACEHLLLRLSYNELFHLKISRFQIHMMPHFFSLNSFVFCRKLHKKMSMSTQ